MGATIKNAFDRNVDYTKNIDIFDESLTDARNMMLTTKKATIPYSLVNYSFPTGTIRVKMTDEIKRQGGGFTHFVGPNFGFYAKRNLGALQAHVYRITDIKTTVGQDVMEIGFELDGVKDFCQQYQEHGFSAYLDSDEYNVRIVKSTQPALWDRTLTTGEEMSDGTTFYKRGGFSQATRTRWYLVTGKISGHLVATYALLPEELLTLYNTLLTSDESEKMASQIYRIEAIDIAGIDGDYMRKESFIIEGNTIFNEVWRVMPFRDQWGDSEYVIKYTLAEGHLSGSIYDNGGEFAAETQLYVEGFGIVPLDYMLKYRLNKAYEEEDNRNIKFVVWENIISGETMLEIDGVQLLQKSQNPTMPILSNAAPLAIRQYLTNQANNMVTNTFNSAMNALAVGVVSPTMGIAAGAGSIIGGVMSTATSAMNMKNQLRGIGPTVSEGANGYIYRGIFYEYYAPNYTIKHDGWSAGVAYFYGKNGFPCDKWGSSNEFLDTHKYWCLMTGKIKGSKEWVNACVSDIESGYIVYNYEDGYEVV